ncbi:MAG: hypothetical protein PHE55_14855, partial [Methylococcaceae bacterium]|nr:hypothetical protein [Methylococcaceae bacterium]
MPIDQSVGFASLPRDVPMRRFNRPLKTVQNSADIGLCHYQGRKKTKHATIPPPRFDDESILETFELDDPRQLSIRRSDLIAVTRSDHLDPDHQTQ